jgi:hypothetical protein
MSSLDVNKRTIFFGEGGVLAKVRTTNPSPLWVLTMFVIKGAFEHQYFFSAPMLVGIELGIGRPFN